jgi:hypothetical protein
MKVSVDVMLRAHVYIDIPDEKVLEVYHSRGDGWDLQDILNIDETQAIENITDIKIKAVYAMEDNLALDIEKDNALYEE